MTQSSPSSTLAPASASAPWSAELLTSLAPEEAVLAGLQLDLDERLHFTQGWLVVTNRRLIGRAPGAPGPQSWDIAPGMVLSHTDHAGVGTLELTDGQRRLAAWRYTLGHNAEALRLADTFDAQRAALTEGAQAARPDTDVCPTCKAPLPPGEDTCPQCSRELEQPPSTWALLRLWRFARPYRWELLAGFALLLLGTGATLVPPYLTMPLMDNVLIPYQNGKPVDYGLVTLYLSGLFGAALVAWALGWARTYLLARVSERISADLRTTTYEHLLKLSLEYFGGKRTGDLMARIGSESDRISVFLSLHLLDFATDVLMIAMTAVILVSIDPWLALVTLVPLPFIAWMIHLVRDRLRHGFEKIDRIWSEITNVLADTIPGIRVVKAFAQEKREVARFREANKHNLTINDRVNAVWSLFTPTVTLLTEVGLLVVWIFGIYQVSHNAITVGVLVAFLTYISRFYTRLDSMSRIVSVTQKAAAGAKRIFDILDHVSSVPEPAKPVHIEQVNGAIELRDLGFRYGNRAVIRGLNLSIRPGEMIGLVGHSGSGKSTLVNLICRFYDVSEGAIRVDGVDIRSLPISEFRRNIGLVLQEPFLFFGTIADNIAYGKPDATREEIIAAARAAHAHEFILRLPHGYDSLVGERGQALSGGERQRISIARALLINPRILIMDEATSSVDTTTEKEIQKALDNLVQGRTTIAIAHRLSTLRKADRLVVMDRGQIVEVGSHDELLAREGAYFRLYQAQARNVDADTDMTSDGERVDAAEPA
ncbi:cyanophycin metabolism-associated ABC transporter [Ralstonia mannitolilytica]|uniref:Multidrug export ATP-binding/permease protein SAV1866 n=1 Tax=Ralstonia mannitolilytica TaxID=105219 RepID=A0AAJ4ZNQ1_9RALS|nr:ABC transporter ATP-binding protein [Ralstonia mannitolilytica]CAG2130670.1 Vitamin B12 import ATP-binding protein BtuD [Ralstonia mannitolilytica]CAJ0735324.1 Vitamin B12 import ATP-binding protein BtuD [Ralstonia mannitolilytica]SUE24631.1 Putative multidrug export ATP-binding/permease protein SAV1866 [Ralstonia mannitolilytica]SUE25465.1 Putative multidrug export ATP-binding/permease protein SAV1866 [Ralstonia mannitolilytica]SUE35274.1 Putative multidrug export ATP-binding/permease prot